MDRVSLRQPLILAGHSFGGALARVEWQKRKNRVAAMVLIDAAPPDKMPFAQLTREEAVARAEKMMAGVKMPEGDPKIRPPHDKLPAELQQAELWAERRARADFQPEQISLAVLAQWRVSSGLQNVNFGDTPLVVLTRDNPDDWVASQKAMAQLSTKNRFLVAEGSGHDIELEKPQAVVDAIRQAVAMVKPQLAK